VSAARKGASRRGWLAGCAAAVAAWPSLAATPPTRAWFNAHPDIRFAPESAYGPFVFVQPGGGVAGLSVDLLAAVASQVGMPFRMLAAQPLAQILDDVQAHRADLVSSLRPTPQRSAFMRFTRPYVDVPAVLAVRKPQHTLLKALNGRPVGVGRGYAVEGFVRQHYPGVSWVPLADDEAVVRALAAGALDAAVLDVASLAYVMRQLGIDSVDVAQSVNFRYPLSFAVRNDWPGLVDILDDGLTRVPRSRREQITQRWLGPFAPMLQAPLSEGTIWGTGMLAAGAGAAAWAALSRRRASLDRRRSPGKEESPW
jgi:ABC-type amino acid transport substrate-binding protein